MNSILWTLGLSALLVGTFTDIRTREVPDWVSYGLMMAAGAARLILAIAFADASIFWEGAIGFGIFVALAYLMYYAGQWGGGDSKILMGLGAIFGFTLDWHAPLIGFWVNMLLAGSVYGLIYSLVLSIIHRKRFAKEWKKRSESMKKVKVVVIIVAAVLAIGAWFVGDFIIRTILLTFALFALFSVYLFVFIKAVENSCMLKYVPPDRLAEGDWIVNDVIVDKKRIAGPKDLGIELDQIAELKKLAEKGKIKSVLIKEGIPFVPSFLVAYVILWFWGSAISLLI